MTEVIKFPTNESKKEWLIGPFEEYRVVVDGRQIPNLSGRKLKTKLSNGTFIESGKILLCVDNRFLGEFSTEQDAQQAAWLIGQAMAIASGYSHLGALNKDVPFAPILSQIDEIE